MDTWADEGLLGAVSTGQVGKASMWGTLGVQRVPQGRGLGGKEAFHGGSIPSYLPGGPRYRGRWTDRNRCREIEAARETWRGKEKIKMGGQTHRDTHTEKESEKEVETNRVR